jgi:hypothetical protein
MSRILLAALALLVAGPVCFGQTNSPATATVPSPRPAPKLPAEPKQSAPASSMPAGNNAVMGQMTLAAKSAESAAMSRIEGKSLIQPNRPIDDSGLETPPSFKPKITHIGRAEFYSSVSTAVARKNPLCLLDTTFLRLSW